MKKSLIIPVKFEIIDVVEDNKSQEHDQHRPELNCQLMFKTIVDDKKYEKKNDYHQRKKI